MAFNITHHLSKSESDSEAVNSAAVVGGRRLVTFCFYHAGRVPAHGGQYCRLDSQSGALLEKTLPKVKTCVLSLFLLKKSKREGRMAVREGTGIGSPSHLPPTSVCPPDYLEAKGTESYTTLSEVYLFVQAFITKRTW